MSYADAMEDRIKALVADKIELLAALKATDGTLQESCSPYHPGTGSDSQWLHDRDRVFRENYAIIAKHEAPPS